MAERGRGAGETLYGVGPVLEALRAGRRKLHRLWLLERRERADARFEEIRSLAERAGLRPEPAARAELDQRAAGGAHQGVVAEADAPPRVELAQLCEPSAGEAPLVVVLDRVQDPQNLGAVLRSAECAGASGVVVPRDRAAPLTPAAVKVAEGAVEHLPLVEVTNLRQALERLKQGGLWVVGLDAPAPRAWCEVDLAAPTALVLGSEGEGLRRLTRETCDILASIPMQGRIPSLNVAATAAVVLFEARRQRRAKAATGAGHRGRGGPGV